MNNDLYEQAANHGYIAKAEGTAQHIVMDIETLSTAKNAAIVSIGAVAITDEGDINGMFYYPVDIDSCLEAGMVVDASTIKWWMNQNEAARNVFNAPASDLLVVLCNFKVWCNTYTEQNKRTYFWGNGPEFDNAILDTAFRLVSTALTPPWKYNEAQSLRTISYINHMLNLGAVYPEPRVAHHALFDAEAEAKFIINVLKALKERV